jgi:hypothetical protein
MWKHELSIRDRAITEIGGKLSSWGFAQTLVEQFLWELGEMRRAREASGRSTVSDVTYQRVLDHPRESVMIGIQRWEIGRNFNLIYKEQSPIWRNVRVNLGKCTPDIRKWVEHFSKQIEDLTKQMADWDRSRFWW